MSVTIDRPVAAPQPAAAPKRTREYWALAALLVATAVAYLWNLSASGWANAFYSAAVQAASVSWKAFFFGSSDAANSITVDKPPASLWVMGLSARVFGLNSWSILVPQVLIGVASVALLWATVRRHFGAAAGLLAGLVLALTPVAVLMFRFDNPDALLVLLMIAAVWATLRGVEDGRTRWMVLTGVFVGFGFLTKQLQVMLVVPPLALTYLIAGPPKLGERILQLFAALGGLIVSAGWWLATVELWPAGSRPWIGGSQNNSILELTLGYNGFGRLNGDERGSVGGMPGGGMWGSTGITRLFEPAQGGQIAWLLPAALILLVAGLVLCGRAARTDVRRASFVAWGSWLVVTGLVFSFMAGIFHSYYTVALAPAVAALVGAGAVTLWRRRDLLWVRIVAAVTIAVTAATAWILLGRSPDFVPWLRSMVVIVGALAAVTMLVPAVLRARAAVVVIVTALLTGLAGPVAYAVNTIGTGHSGSIPSAGPRVEGEMGRGPGGLRGSGEQLNGMPMPDRRGNGGGAFEMPGGMPGGFGGGGAGGGLLDAGNPGDELTALLRECADDYTWVAAAIGSNSASGYQLATERPVMPIGGFNGSDPSPTLEQFQQYVADGKVHYFVAGGMGGGRGGDGAASQISAWVRADFTSTTVDGVTLYDLTR